MCHSIIRTSLADLEPPSQAPQQGCETLYLLEVLGREPFEPAAAVGRQGEAHHAVVVIRADPTHEPGLDGPVDQSYRAVVLEEEVLRHVADGRAPGVAVTAHREHELVLGRGESLGARLLLAPVLEATQARP